MNLEKIILETDGHSFVNLTILPQRRVLYLLACMGIAFCLGVVGYAGIESVFFGVAKERFEFFIWLAVGSIFSIGSMRFLYISIWELAGYERINLNQSNQTLEIRLGLFKWESVEKISFDHIEHLSYGRTRDHGPTVGRHPKKRMMGAVQIKLKSGNDKSILHHISETNAGKFLDQCQSVLKV